MIELLLIVLCLLPIFKFERNVKFQLAMNTNEDVIIFSASYTALLNSLSRPSFYA